jgi:hypothetical protein
MVMGSHGVGLRLADAGLHGELSFGQIEHGRIRTFRNAILLSDRYCPN